MFRDYHSWFDLVLFLLELGICFLLFFHFGTDIQWKRQFKELHKYEEDDGKEYSQSNRPQSNPINTTAWKSNDSDNKELLKQIAFISIDKSANDRVLVYKWFKEYENRGNIFLHQRAI